MAKDAPPSLVLLIQQRCFLFCSHAALVGWAVASLEDGWLPGLLTLVDHPRGGPGEETLTQPTSVC